MKKKFNFLLGVFIAVLSLLVVKSENCLAGGLATYNLRTRTDGSLYMLDKTGALLNPIGTVVRGKAIPEPALISGYTRLRFYSNKTGLIINSFDVKTEDEVVVSQYGHEIFRKKMGANIFAISIPDNAVVNRTVNPVTPPPANNNAAVAGIGILGILLAIVCCL
jgi:hypothetical protein